MFGKQPVGTILGIYYIFRLLNFNLKYLNILKCKYIMVFQFKNKLHSCEYYHLRF